MQKSAFFTQRAKMQENKQAYTAFDKRRYSDVFFSFNITDMTET